MTNQQIKLGVDRIIDEDKFARELSGLKIALVGHPASVTNNVQHSLDALIATNKFNISAAFGPQHGMRGDKQDNMVESENYIDPIHKIPIYSLYGEVRRPTKEMMDSCDVLLFDVQDLGCRIYTYITTLLYLLEAAAEHNKALWILDRPNPAGRPIEGNLLTPGWESFVGASTIVMRHGLTIGEIAKWFVLHHHLDVDLKVISMKGYNPNAAPGYGWPILELAWVNPSPNAASLNMARCYAGTVLLEGTNLSEGRGTTFPLEVMGAPDIDIDKIIKKMTQLGSQWMQGIKFRSCYFEPTFHKFQGILCNGLQIHTDLHSYNHDSFKPFRFTVLFLKSLRLLYPEYDLWRKHAYEYELGKLPFDVINGGPFIREWIDDPKSSISHLEETLSQDELTWQQQTKELLIY